MGAPRLMNSGILLLWCWDRMEHYRQMASLKRSLCLPRYPKWHRALYQTMQTHQAQGLDQQPPTSNDSRGYRGQWIRLT